MKFVLFFVALGLLSPLLVTPSEIIHQEASHGRDKRSTEESSYFYYQEADYPKDCKEVYEQCEGTAAESGIYMIKPDGADEPFNVYCNNSVDGGQWTVIQRRIDGSVEFYRNWEAYKNGFGFLNREFWLGNDKISLLTNQKTYSLRIDFTNDLEDTYFANYDLFRISDETTKYRLVGLGIYASNGIFDGMTVHRNQSFTTLDVDNDLAIGDNLAQSCHGAWWYTDYCGHTAFGIDGSNLNGLYTHGSARDKGLFFDDLLEIRYVEMKIRPLQ